VEQTSYEPKFREIGGLILDIDESALSDLIDDHAFIEINKSRARFNLFEAMGGVRAELRHTNFLGFLLSPSRSHGLGSKPLQTVLRAILKKFPSDKRPFPALEVVVGDLDDARVFRELDNIDLLVELRELKVVVVIENKVDAKAGDGQLARYKAVVDKKYPSWRKLFVYLTPAGDEPDRPEYVGFSYSELAQIVESLVKDGAHSYGPDVVLILTHYVEMLRRNIVEDDPLRNLAVKLYERHADALEFIFKCKPQGTSLLPIAQQLVEENPSLTEDKHTSTIFRFLPTKWLDVPGLKRCPIESWTKTGRNVLFEIKSFKSEGAFSDRILLALILGPSELSLRGYFFDSVQARRDVFLNAGKAIGQSWVTIFSRELLSSVAAENMDDQQKQTAIEDNWRDFVNGDLPHLTDAVYEIALKAPM
jgi:hypothetical protein